jgi:maleylacetoacetate isomerase
LLKLYDYIRSSAAYRVRIALALKGLAHDLVPVDLRAPNGGEQGSPAFMAVNPQGLVPALAIDDGVLTQSLAIIEYLDETHPEPPLLPRAPAARARVRAMALAIAADIHPIQNLRVLNYLRDQLCQPEEAVLQWARHWIERGLAAFQALVPAGEFCAGDQITLADVVLAPQLVNARRFGCALAGLERLVAIDARLRALPAFKDTAPPPQAA